MDHIDSSEYRQAFVRVNRPTVMDPLGYNLYIGGPHHGNQHWAVEEIVLKVMTEEERLRTSFHPAVKLDKTQAQVLMDDLWNCGIRPTEGSGSAGSFAAQTEHLKDLRALLGKQAGVSLG